MQNLVQEYTLYSRYFAPRGKERLLFLGEQIAQRHLHFQDRLIGIIGDAGSGKSSLIKGMFPGLELTNDDDVIDPRKIMQIRDLSDDFSSSTTYHIDMRFQTAFTQMHEIIEFVNAALEQNRRIIVEHFDLLYPALNINADLLIGIGEEILVANPSIFGPLPDSIYQIVHTSLVYRKMAHTVEDLTIYLLVHEFDVDPNIFYSSDVKKGFVLRFIKKIELDFEKLSMRIGEELAKNMPVCYHDEKHIIMGDTTMPCSGPRLHLLNTQEVSGFTLIPYFIVDVKTNTFCLVGTLDQGDKSVANLNRLS